MEVKPGYRTTEVGVIPADWAVVLLDSVATRGSGHTPDKAHPEYWEGDIKWISLQDSNRLDRLYLFDTAAKITPAGIANSSAKMYPEGTVVLSRDAGVGKSAIMKHDMAVSQHFIAWKCSSSLNNHFLYYWLQLRKSEFQRIAMGNTIKTIGLPYFRQLPVPLPTKAEQEIIAEALSDADALIESLEQLLTKKRLVKQGALQELLTGKKRLPGFSGEWELRALGEIATANKGSQLSSSLMTRHGTFAHLNGGISPSGYTDKSNVPSDTIAISEGGNSCGYVQFMSEAYWCGGHCYSVIPNGVDNRFLYHALKGEEPSIMDLRVGSGLPNVQKTALLAFNLRCPKASEEQTAIAAILSDMDAEIAGLDTKLVKARALKQGMMQELLTGRIRLV